jgi:hypothetical protein
MEKARSFIENHMYLSKRNVFVLGLEGEFLGKLVPRRLDNLGAIVSRSRNRQISSKIRKSKERTLTQPKT